MEPLVKKPHKSDPRDRGQRVCVDPARLLSLAKPRPTQSVVRGYITEDYGLRIYSIEAGIAKKASWIRSQYPGFKAMDALQLAVAEAYYCDCFLTNDKQLRQYAGLNCVVVDDITNT